MRKVRHKQGRVSSPYWQCTASIASGKGVVVVSATSMESARLQAAAHFRIPPEEVKIVSQISSAF